MGTYEVEQLFEGLWQLVASDLGSIEGAQRWIARMRVNEDDAYRIVKSIGRNRAIAKQMENITSNLVRGYDPSFMTSAAVYNAAVYLYSSEDVPKEKK